MELDYYEILGVARDASLDTIKRAYHELVRKYHPDVNQNSGSAEMFLSIQEAYEQLKETEKRKKYDIELSHEEFVQPVTRLKVLKSRKAIERLNEDQLVYALMEIICLKSAEEIQSPRVHVCLVIDQSTSMHGNRMDMVKMNVNQVVNKLNPDDLLSIITFSDEANLFLSPTLISNRASIEAKITQIGTTGSTEIKKGIKAGIDLLWQDQRQGYICYLILLTDGHTYGDEEDCYQLAKEAAEHSIMISAMGIGSEWNEKFLEKLTAITGGSTLFVNSKNALSQYLERLFSSIDYVYAKKMTLHLRNNPQVEMRYLFQLEPNVVQYELTGESILLGDLYFGKKSIYLMEFLVHPLIKKDKDVELISGQIKMELPHEKKVTARITINENLPVVDEPQENQPPAEIVRAISKVTLYDMQERSRDDVKVGSFDRATRRLNYLASRLLAEGEVRLATRVLSESESIKMTHKYSQDGEKELKYGTKQLLALPKP